MGLNFHPEHFCCEHCSVILFYFIWINWIFSIFFGLILGSNWRQHFCFTSNNKIT